MRIISPRLSELLRHPRQSFRRATSKTDAMHSTVKQDDGVPGHADSFLKSNKDINASASLPHLPEEIWLKILTLADLSPRGLLAIRTVNKQMLRIGSDNQLWGRYISLPQLSQEHHQLLLTEARSLPKNTRKTLQRLWHGKLSPEQAVIKFPNNRPVVFAAVGQTGWAFEYADAALKADKDVALAAVGQIGWMLRHADAALKADKDVVLAAVGQNGQALEYADAALKTDKDVVLAAVEQSGQALEHADAVLKADKDVVLAAVGQNSEALKYAVLALQMNSEVQAAANAVH